MPEPDDISFGPPSLLRSNALLTRAERDHLDLEGYLVLDSVLAPSFCAELRDRVDALFAEEDDDAAASAMVRQDEEWSELKSERLRVRDVERVANLALKDASFRELLVEPRVQAAVAHVMRAEYKLSAMASRAALPGQGRMTLHEDTRDVPTCQTTWALDDFTRRNGGTALVPRTHKLDERIGELVADPWRSQRGERVIEVAAGSVIVYDGRVWHRGTLNRSGARRMAILTFWIRRDGRPMAYPREAIDPSVRETLTGLETYLLDV